MTEFLAEWGAVLPLALAGWGAIVSTALAVIKISEVWGSRYKLAADFSSSSWDHGGNVVHVHNLSARPVTVTYWEIFAARSARTKDGRLPLASAEWDDNQSQIAAYSSLKLEFVGDSYFSTADQVLQGRRLFIKIYAAGGWSRVIRLLPYHHPFYELLSKFRQIALK